MKRAERKGKSLTHFWEAWLGKIAGVGKRRAKSREINLATKGRKELH